MLMLATMVSTGWVSPGISKPIDTAVSPRASALREVIAFRRFETTRAMVGSAWRMATRRGRGKGGVDCNCRLQIVDCGFEICDSVRHRRPTHPFRHLAAWGSVLSH